MVSVKYESLINIDTKTLLSELAFRSENFSKYKILQGKFNFFQDYNGQDWIMKIEKRVIE